MTQFPAPPRSQTRPRIGIQLYTVRDMTDPDSFPDTLSALARMGFEGVEFAWQYGGLDPSRLAEHLDARGLACCGLHVQLDELESGDPAVYRIAEAVRARYITTSLAGREGEWDALLPRLDRAGRRAAEHGLRFTYHNHWQELNAPPGESAFDRLRRETDPRLVGIELDLGWVHKAGWDAMALWHRLAGRIPQIHLRDYDRAADRVCDVGDGFLDLEAVWRQARACGTDWLIFEQDRFPVSPLASCRVCMARIPSRRPQEPREPQPVPDDENG